MEKNFARQLAVTFCKPQLITGPDVTPKPRGSALTSFLAIVTRNGYLASRLTQKAQVLQTTVVVNKGLVLRGTKAAAL